MESAYCWQLYFALYPRHSQTNTQRCWGKSKVICMKKAISILMCVLLSLTILYPAGIVITACFGYSFELISISAFAIAIAALSVCIVVLDLICKNRLENNTIRILLAIITPLSLINAVFYIFKCSQICIILIIISSILIKLHFKRILRVKIISLIVAVEQATFYNHCVRLCICAI